MKIMMISDYRTCIGGIEQYVSDATRLLSTQNHSVQVVGLLLSPALLNRIRPYLLPVTACNVRFALQLSYHIIIQKPQLLWLHSVSRYIGWFPVWVSSMFGIKTWMMYHDLGYFHPYPSLVTQVSQIPTQWNLSSWIDAGRAAGKLGALHTVFMALKFASTSMIRRVLLRYTHIHLVPSPYMIDIVRQWGVPADTIQVLGHFGRIE